MSSSPYSRPLLSLSLALSIIALLALFLTVVAIKRADPEALSAFLARDSSVR